MSVDQSLDELIRRVNAGEDMSDVASDMYDEFNPTGRGSSVHEIPDPDALAKYKEMGYDPDAEAAASGYDGSHLSEYAIDFNDGDMAFENLDEPVEDEPVFGP